MLVPARPEAIKLARKAFASAFVYASMCLSPQALSAAMYKVTNFTLPFLRQVNADSLRQRYR
jgi:hypothetical protein